MTEPHMRTRAAFRLNLEQQKKRAKDFLKAVRAGEPTALSRLTASHTGSSGSPVQLADAQFKLANAQRVIAHELGFASWAELKTHIAAMDQARLAIAEHHTAPDLDRTTLHVRCGSDIRAALVAAGFRGDFLEHSYPYAHGPITTTPGHFEREAQFIADFAGAHMDVSFDAALARRHQEERELAESVEKYERIALWMEHDCFDQFVLVRCLARYAQAADVPSLELIQIDRFPGSMRFIGLGQLPEEALRLLWERRQPVTRATLDLASSVWHALSRDTPRRWAALMRTGCADLPYLAAALQRLLQELPAVQSGLSFTERMILEALAPATDPLTVNQLFAWLTYERDPLPFATDFFLHTTLERMRNVSRALLIRDPAESLWRDRLTISDHGRRALAGELDVLSLDPQPRWVGNVHIGASQSTWRWDERSQDVVGP
jgi:hypothetical protein